MNQDDIWSALNFIPADNRKTWFEMGMAIKYELGDAGFSLWDDWSRTADTYKKSDASAVWRSIRNNCDKKPITIGSVFHTAKRYGWKSHSKPIKATPKPKPAPSPTKMNTGAYGRELWLKSSRERVAEHPYAKTKGIDWPAGAGCVVASGRVIGKSTDCIVVPIRDLQTDKVVAVQCINADGAKQSFGPISGNAFVCGNTLDKSLRWFVVEGWADAVSMVFHHYKGNAVALAACGKSMMESVAKRADEVFQPEQLILLEDAS